jgi:hypothetical protein
MNAAPAELLQLLTIAALQPSPPVLRPATLVLHVTLFTSQSQRLRKEKAAMPEQIRQCGLSFSLSIRAYWIESASHFLIGFLSGSHLKKRRCSPFDKFNHVKYTKTLSVRNCRT